MRYDLKIVNNEQ